MNDLPARSARMAALLLLFLMGTGLVIYSGFHVIAAAEASTKIGNAESVVGKAFEAALDAERSGANVSGLLVKLDEAGRILSDAEMAYKNGNLTGADAEADSAVSAVSGVEAEASRLKSVALADAQGSFRWDLAFSLIGSAAFLLVLSVVWRRFKRVRGPGLPSMRSKVKLNVEV